MANTADLMLDIIRRKELELGKDHDALAANVFDQAALNLFEQNYVLLNANMRDENSLDEAPRDISIRVNISTPREEPGKGQSNRSENGSCAYVDLAEMSRRACEMQGVVPSRYAVITAMHLEDARNLASADCMLECVLNNEPIGVHYTASNSSKLANEQTASLGVVMAGQQMHLANGGRMIYGHQGGKCPVIKKNVGKYLPMINRNSILELTRIPPGSKAVEYSSPTARIREVRNNEELICGDEFVNLMYKHPHLFTSDHKVTAIRTPGEGGNEIVNIRMHQDDFTSVHEAVQREILEPLRRHVIDLNTAKPLMFKIVPVEKPSYACKDATDTAQDAVINMSGAAAWKTAKLLEDKGEVTFGIKIDMQYV